jgi:hypothetical protein
MSATTQGNQGDKSDRDDAEFRSFHLLQFNCCHVLPKLCNNHQGDQQGNNAIEHLARTPNPSSEASATLEQETGQ